MALYIMILVLGLVVTLGGLLLSAGGVLGMLGRRLPPTHTASVRVDLPASREKLFTLLNGVERFPEWCPEFTKIDRLPDRAGRSAWRQHMGRNAFVIVTEIDQPPSRVKRTIADEKAGMFFGSWDHELTDKGGGETTLTITEVGTVKGDIPRAVMHYVIGEDATLRKFVERVRAHVTAHPDAR